MCSHPTESARCSTMAWVLLVDGMFSGRDMSSLSCLIVVPSSLRRRAMYFLCFSTGSGLPISCGGGGQGGAAAARLCCLRLGRDRGVGRDRPAVRPRESQPKPPLVPGLGLVIPRGVSVGARGADLAAGLVPHRDRVHG